MKKKNKNIKNKFKKNIILVGKFNCLGNFFYWNDNNGGKTIKKKEEKKREMF